MDTTKSQEANNALQEEIRVLEQKLEQKKQEAGDANKEKPEKEIFREVLKEHVESVRTPSASTPSFPASAVPLQPVLKSDDKAKAAQDEEIRALVELALAKSVEYAVRLAEKESPYLLDELHDHLADEYYDKLVQLRKINTF
ncbi:MAG: hypothetical protein HYT37_02025 [Candidatus Sungbacteria bacterium]|nr:hypothetical protein [Candidatus Sungbacteria bacterium]